MTRAIRLPLAAAAAALAAACASDISPVTITNFTLITIDATRGVCRASPGGAISEGALDVARGTGYVAGLLVRNDLLPNADTTIGRVNSNNATLDTATITYRGIGAAAPSKAVVPINIRVSAGGSAEALVTLLPSDKGMALQGAPDGARVVASVVLSGKLDDGSDITASAREFPIQLCSGCVSLACEAPGTDGLVAPKDGWGVAACSPDSMGQRDGMACVELAKEDEGAGQ